MRVASSSTSVFHGRRGPDCAGSLLPTLAPSGAAAPWANPARGAESWGTLIGLTSGALSPMQHPFKELASIHPVV